jgi:hypothetical protein
MFKIRFNIWNTGPDHNFDRIAHLAKLVFNAKGVYISLVDGDEQWVMRGHHRIGYMLIKSPEIFSSRFVKHLQVFLLQWMTYHISLGGMSIDDRKRRVHTFCAHAILQRLVSPL